MGNIFDAIPVFRCLREAEKSELKIGAKPWHYLPNQGPFFDLYRKYGHLADPVQGIDALFSRSLSELQQFAIHHGYPSDAFRPPLDWGVATYANHLGVWWPHQASRDSIFKLPAVRLRSNLKTYRLFGRDIAVLSTLPQTISGVEFINELVVVKVGIREALSGLQLVEFAMSVNDALPDAAISDFTEVIIPMLDFKSEPDLASHLVGAWTEDVEGITCDINQARQLAAFRLNEKQFQAESLTAVGGVRSGVRLDRPGKTLVIPPPLVGFIRQRLSRTGLGHCCFPLSPFWADVEDCREPNDTQ